MIKVEIKPLFHFLRIQPGLVASALKFNLSEATLSFFLRPLPRALHLASILGNHLGGARPLVLQVSKMKVKRQKQVRKTIRFYKVCFGFKEPYKVLLDGNFIHQSVHSQ